MNSQYDVAIIGGGPGGSTAATLLARHGRRVIVLEREKFPRFHIGESLLPYTMETFERLGLRAKLDAMCLPKIGAHITTACGKKTSFHFRNGFRLKHSRAYNVCRADFDQVMLQHAAENGAEVREETTVKSVAFDADGATLQLAPREGAEATIRASYVLDCSGRNSVIGQQFQLRQTYPDLKKFSVFAHYENVQSDGETDGTVVRLIRAEDRWFWMIPVSPTVTSVGVVMEVDSFKQLKLMPEAVLEQSIHGQPVIAEQMRAARRVSPVHSAGDYSYRHSEFAGERWLLAGDAAGFIDPIFSTGVFIAIMSGERAADTLHAVLEKPARREVLFARYARRLNRVMDMYLDFVRGWYQHEFIEVLSSPTQHLQLAPAVNAVLAGNIAASFAIWWRMKLFYLVVYLQRFAALVPRLSLKPPATTAS